MDKSQNKHVVMVGLFIFIGLIILIAGVLMVGNLHETFKRKMFVISIFDDVDGLQAGSNVWFSGVKIGTVGSVSLYGKSQVKIVIKIELKAQEYIRKNSKVKIGTDGLIGNKILEIYGGSQTSADVQEGDTLEVEKTFSQEDVMSTLQQNNKNLLAATADIKVLTKRLVDGEGTIGKLFTDNSVYDQLHATTRHLELAAGQAELLAGNLNRFSARLDKKGTLINELVTDTVTFRSVKTSVGKLHEMMDTATVFVNQLKAISKDSVSVLGVLVRNRQASTQVKHILKNLEISSVKLADDLEAVQHNFLLKRFFKKKAKAVVPSGSSK